MRWRFISSTTPLPTQMKNSIVIVRNGCTTIDGRFFFPIAGAMARARMLSRQEPDAAVYVNSSDHDLRLVQSFKAVRGRITEMTTRYRGKVVTDDETIPDNLWHEFNSRR